MDDAGLDALTEAIRNMHGCDADWIESVSVHETYNGETVWDGEVQVFAVNGHDEADRAYAWSHATEGGKRRFFAVLGLPPVDSAVMAVRAVIASSAQRR